MSDNTRLGITISATDTASASIAQLQATVKALQQTLRDLGGTAADAGGKITASLNAEISSIQREISARTGQVAAIKSTTAAIQEQTAAAAVLHRTLQQGIDASVGANIDRTMKSAAESARVLATSLNAAAEADARLRDEALLSAAALERQKLAGSGLRLTPAAGFGKRIEEQVIGVRPELDPRARAQMQAQLEETFAKLAPVAEMEGVAVGRAFSTGVGGGAAGAGALLQRESRHIVGLFDSLARGQRGQALSSIGAAARDAGLGVAALSTSIIGLVAIMGGVALVKGAESMGKWATETRAAASAAGMSIENYSRLQGALSLSGLKADEADATLRRFAVNLASAIADPASNAAQALHNLGISQEDLAKTGGDMGAALKLVADAFVRNADGAAKSSNMNEIFGRGFERIIPLLQHGAAGLDEAGNKAEKLGITLNEKTATALEKTGENAKTLGETISGNATKAFENWEPVIDKIVDALKILVGVIGEVVSGLGKLASAPVTAIEAVTKAVSSAPGTGHIQMIGSRPVWRPGAAPAPEMGPGDVSGSMAPAKVQPPPFVHGGQETVLQTMRQQMAEAADLAKNGAKTASAAREAEGKAEIAVIQKTLAEARLNAEQRAQIETELHNKSVSLYNSNLSAETSAANKAAKQSYEDFAAGEKLKISAADGSSQKILAIYDEWITAANEKYKQHVNVIETLEREKVQAINTARLSEIKQGAQDTEQQNRLRGMDATLGQMAKGTYNYGGKEATSSSLKAESKDALEQAAQVKVAADSEIAALVQVRDTAEQGSATQKAASQEIMSVLLQSKSQEIELYKKAGEAAQQAAEKAMEGFKKFFDSVGSAFETFTSSALKALIAPQQVLIKAGLTTIKENMRGAELKQAFASMLTSIASDLGKSIETAIGSTIAKALSGGAADSIGQLLSQTFGKLLGQVTGGALGGATGAAAGSAPVVAAITASSGSVVGAISASTASIVSAITTSSITQATVPKPLGFAAGGIVPSAQGGMVAGGIGGTLAILHPKEMVLPAHLSQGIQGLIGGRGGNFSNNLNYSPTINTGSRGRGGTGMTRSEFGQMMSQHGGALLGEARNMMRSGWRPS